MTTPTAEGWAGATRRTDLQSISLVGLAHGTSHFFHRLLSRLVAA